MSSSSLLEKDLLQKETPQLKNVQKIIDALDTNTQEGLQEAQNILQDELDIHFKNTNTIASENIRDIQELINSVQNEDTTLEMLSSEEVHELKLLTGVPIDTLNNDNREEFCKEYANNLRSSVEDTFANGIYEAIKDIPDDFSKIQTLFALISSPDSVSNQQMMEILPPGFERLERFETHENGFGVLPHFMNASKKLNCAGRSLITSSVLNKLHINHFIASPDEHSLVIIHIPNTDQRVYSDPQQGLLFTFPNSALKKEEGDVHSGAKVEIDLTQAQAPITNGIGLTHKSFVLYKPDEGITEQNMSNTISALGKNWLEKDYSAEKANDLQSAIGILKDNFFTDEMKIDQFMDRAPALMELFTTGISCNWKTNSQIIDFILQNKLFSLGENREESSQKILDNLKNWKSRGSGDAIAQALSDATNKENIPGVNLEYFFKTE